ncbi:MAG: ester cyclase [Actinomycetia bacterium]|nr:ester cyclase [Actinomycetes bacterium]MCP4225292.1 ester cyclase [Actinomycetes bacterium]MCP5035593.1 ester cyclase [Actinomycetes bacterium]
MSKARSEEVMRRYLTEVLGERKFELIPDFVAEDMVDHTQAIRGPAALDAHARGFCENITDLEIEVKQIFATDDAAIGIWRWRGTPNHPMGVSAKGNPIHPRHIASIFQFRDGMLADYRPFVDAVDVAVQMATPPAPSDDGSSD